MSPRGAFAKPEMPLVILNPNFYIAGIMKQLCLFALAVIVVTACQKKETLNETFVRLDTEISKNSKAYSTLEEATSTIGHRLTGSDNGHKAEEYTYNKFKEYGFEDVAYQEFEVVAWSRGNIAVQIGGDSVKAVTLGHSPVSADVTGELVDMGSGLESDFAAKPDAAKGKIAFFYIGILPDAPEGSRNLHRSEKTAIAIRYGAKGVIIYNQVDGGVLFTGTASVTGDLLSIPAICISKEDGFSLKEKLKTKKISTHIVMTNHSDPIKARNVIATIKGSDLPEEKILIGGHLDSWDLATGAIDNGIGSFSILDIARAFKANKLAPRRTVQFIMFMGEEQGLLGSTFMVNSAIKDGSIEKMKYMVNLDMTGNPIGINAGGKLDDTTFFQNIGAEVAKIDTLFKNKISGNSGLHSDHQPFMLEGIPVLGLNSNLDRSIYGCYHANCDDFKLVNEDHIRNTARFGTMILFALADAEKLPASKMDSETTKQFMIDNNLEEPLKLAGDWKWN
jgi:Zn-dependent M28 family amino/carboxypeptidase